MLMSFSSTNGFFGLGFGGFGMLYDPTMILIIAGMVVSLIASARVKSTFAKYNKVRSMSGLTGAQAAQRVLNSAGIYDVGIQQVSGNLTDHYDPRTKTLNLSQSTFGSNSVAAIGVAAHECGHAIQDRENYSPLVLRSTLVPAANLGSTLSWPIFIAGLLFSMRPLLYAGIILFTLAVIFQLVTLPVEFNASGRAVAILRTSGLMGDQEVTGVKKVLTAAALTYVASLAASILQLLRLIILAGGRNRD